MTLFSLSKSARYKTLPGTFRLNPFWNSKHIFFSSTDRLRRSRYPFFANSHSIFSNVGFFLGSETQQIISPIFIRRNMIHQDSTIGQAGICPGMVSITGQCDLIARFCPNLADHHMVPLTTWIPPVPNRSITSIPCPGLIKIGFLGIGNLVKFGTVRIDDADGCLPVPNIRSGYIPAKKKPACRPSLTTMA